IAPPMHWVDPPEPAPPPEPARPPEPVVPAEPPSPEGPASLPSPQLLSEPPHAATSDAMSQKKASCLANRFDMRHLFGHPSERRARLRTHDTRVHRQPP